jgi:hypothetical protein
MAKFSQGHYVAIAKVMNKTFPDPINAKQWEQWGNVAVALVAMFKADNPKFSTEKFKQACLSGEKLQGLPWKSGASK